MKVLSTDGLTKLIQLIKGAFISVDDTVTTTTVALADVATSGSYNDLSDKPTIPAAQVNSDWNATSGKAEILNKPNLATVATSGSYNDLSNKPTIPDTSTLANKDLSNLSSTGQNIADTTLDQNTNTRLKYWTGTQAQYDAITTKDANTLYNVEDVTSPIISILDSLYPVGAIYIGTMQACPLQTLGIGTWVLVAQDRVLQGAGTRGSVGTTVNESLPTPSHTHTRGSMNITGSIVARGNTSNEVFASATGIAKVGGTEASWGMGQDNGVSGKSYGTISLDASRSWSGSTSQPDNLPAVYSSNAPVQQDGYLVNIWERTA